MSSISSRRKTVKAIEHISRKQNVPETVQGKIRKVEGGYAFVIIKGSKNVVRVACDRPDAVPGSMCVMSRPAGSPKWTISQIIQRDGFSVMQESIIPVYVGTFWLYDLTGASAYATTNSTSFVPVVETGGAAAEFELYGLGDSPGIFINWNLRIRPMTASNIRINISPYAFDRLPDSGYDTPPLEINTTSSARQIHSLSMYYFENRNNDIETTLALHWANTTGSGDPRIYYEDSYITVFKAMKIKV